MYSDALGGPGNYGYFWSSTVNSSSGAYGLGFSNTGVSPANNGSRYGGRSVRCVALNIPIPKIKVLSIAHYSSFVEVVSSPTL